MFETIDCKEWMMFKLFFLSKEATRHCFSFCKKKKKIQKQLKCYWLAQKLLKKRPIISAARAEETLLSPFSPDGQTVAALFNLLCTTSLFPAISFPERATTSTPRFVLFQVAGLVGTANCLHCAAACHEGFIAELFWTIHGSCAHNRRGWSGVKRRTRNCRQTNRLKIWGFTLHPWAKCCIFTCIRQVLFLLRCRDQKSKVKKTLVLISIGSCDCSFCCLCVYVTLWVASRSWVRFLQRAFMCGVGVFSPVRGCCPGTDCGTSGNRIWMDRSGPNQSVSWWNKPKCSKRSQQRTATSLIGRICSECVP